jgi:GMP synthase-like glutamine amidotransferase
MLQYEWAAANVVCGTTRGRVLMRTLCVLQHVEAEYLGLLEDHLEGRNIRFRYCRPFATGGKVPATAAGFDGLVILGAGEQGVVSGALIASIGPELRLVRDFLDRGLPVIGIGAGASILAIAAGGGADEAPLEFAVETAHSVVPDALGGHLPQAFPIAVYLRDRPVLPADARILAVRESGRPAVFQLRDNCVGFLGHPGIKSAMIEDLIMESADAPAGTAETLGRLRCAQAEIAEALGAIMVGLVKVTHLMQPSS